MNRRRIRVSSPALVVCCGLPGVGKSTVSGYVADRLEANRYRSDAVRKELFPNPTYEPAETVETYEELFDRAKTDLLEGHHIVLDATFSMRQYRERVDEITRDVDAEATFVRVTADPAVLRERIENRTDTVSDAGYEEHLEVKASFEAFDRNHVVIDNSGTIEETHRQVDRAVLEPITE